MIVTQSKIGRKANFIYYTPLGTTRCIWTGNPEYVLESDADYLVTVGPIDVLGNGYTDWVQVSDFGFYVPSYATITGIKVSITKQATYAAAGAVTDAELYLMINGEQKGDNKADTITNWSDSVYETVEYGGETDLWGLTSISPEEINAKFGVKFQAFLEAAGLGNTDAALVKHISMTVYFNNAFPVAETPEYLELDQKTKPSKKIWYAKVYNQAGTFLGELNMDDFKNYPVFSFSINENPTDMNLELIYNYNDLRFPSDGQITLSGKSETTYKGVERINNCIKVGNYIKFFISDNEVLNKQIYSGIISGYKYNSSGQKEEIAVNIIPYSSILSSRVLKSLEGSTLVPYNSQDPADMLVKIIEASGLDIQYDADTMGATGVERSYTFNSNYCEDAIKTVIKLSPHGWFGYVFGDDKFYFKRHPEQTTLHTIAKKNVLSISFEKSLIGIKNRIYFLGGGDTPLYNRYDMEGSQRNWGLYEEILNDGRVTEEDTARHLAKNNLKAKGSPKMILEVVIMDNNFSEGGYDIESIKPGDKLRITTDELDMGKVFWGEFIWGVDFWKYGLNAVYGVDVLIESIEYGFNKIVCKCKFEMDRLTERIEDVQKDLQDTQTEDAPELTS